MDVAAVLLVIPDSSFSNEDDRHEGGAVPHHHCTLAVVTTITAHTVVDVVCLTRAPNNINISLTREHYDVVIVVCGGECGSVNVVAPLLPLPTFADRVQEWRTASLNGTVGGGACCMMRSMRSPASKWWTVAGLPQWPVLAS
jgi:hypothetical protein